MLLRWCAVLFFISTLSNHFVATFSVHDEPPGVGRTFIINAVDDAQPEAADNGRRVRRDVPPQLKSPTPPPTTTTAPPPKDDKDKPKLVPRMNYLNDTHKQMMVHWLRKKRAMIILTKDPAGVTPLTPSCVFISYDYGDTYVEKTMLFRPDNDSNAAILEKFFVHPEYDSHIIFNDITNKAIFVTTDAGKTINKLKLNFTPTDITFNKNQPNTFYILDTSDSKRMLWVTEDFGMNWRFIQEYVKSYFWIEDKNGQQQLVFERMLPSNLSTIFYPNKQQKLNVYALEVEKVSMKNDYIFTAMKSKRHSYDIYVSYKFGQKLKCVFDTNLDIGDYLVVDVDVEAKRAFIAVSHTSTLSNLYVSENLAGRDDKVHFTLSLPNVMAHFPNTTFLNTWLNLHADEAFVDMYHVEGVSGVYIASQIITQPKLHDISPANLASRITFDHGGSWRPIVAPERDMEGQPTGCELAKNCSLHISQKFSQLDPDTKTSSMVTSKSAPGVIMATGVIGSHLKGRFGVFISTDAGITWRHALRNFYFFNMGDHGGVMVAAENLRMRGETRYLLYSTDRGENWLKTPFHDDEIRLYGLMTEPDEKTPVFTLFGSLPQEHQWMIVKVNLQEVFQHNCTNEDFKFWSPLQKDENNKYVPCVLGKQKQYKQRISHANCYTGVGFEPEITSQQCECEQIDYECDFGFVRSTIVDPVWHCVRNGSMLEDPYVIPSSCQPGLTYNRTKGYRKISGDACLDGYANQFQPDVIPCPTKHMNNMLLFAKRDKIIQVDMLTLNQTVLDIPNLKNVIAIDFDLSNNCVYWADIVTDTISRFCDNRGTPVEPLVASGLASVEGMALDWVSKNLYFVDGLRARIELIRTDVHHSGRMRRTIVDEKYLIKPRGIAVHPMAGYIFWTDWASPNPNVRRSNLDGSTVKTIADKKNVEWPNGISIDFIANRVYWVDARNDYIASTNLDGEGFKKVNIENKYVSHPFAVAVFKDDVYWDDWRMDSIFLSNKDYGGKVRTLVANMSGLMDIKVIAHGTQHGSNKCGETPSPCSSICVNYPMKQPYYKCLCPDGMEMKDDKCVCPGGVQPFANFTCPKISGTCSSEHFACKSGACVPKLWRCDGENDCGDNSDEQNCNEQSCPPNYFACTNGKCIPHYWKCDYESDCPDGSDELNCPRQNCSENQFRCDNGRCISDRWKCDGENDCRDNSDERNCDANPPGTCKPEEFQCKSGLTKCISMQWYCDGEFDCKDRSDELNCDGNRTCPDTKFSCSGPNKPGECIYKTWVCDGDADCTNGADELNCTNAIVVTAPPIIDPFAPINGTRCAEWMFKCANNKCIPIWWKCDHANDCEDGSDELGCNYSSTPTPIATTPYSVHVCESNMFQCLSGECISMAWVCDKSVDCANGEDEEHCDGHHACNDQKQFKCRVDGNCVPLSAVCNGRLDCPDGSDEEYCTSQNNLPGTATPSCSVGYFPCDMNRCFALAQMCDGKRDCNDGFDEGDKCSNITRVYQVLQMGVDVRSVNESSVQLNWFISLPKNIKLEYMPSLSAVDEAKWKNLTWTTEMEYRLKDLEPNTLYNMTVYVRVNGSDKTISPPAKYFTVRTAEGIPSEPYNLTVQQLNNSDVLLTWNTPIHPKGVITSYEIFWWTDPDDFPIVVHLGDNSTAHILTADFESGKKYSFYVVAHNKGHKSQKSEVKQTEIHAIGVIQSLTIVRRTENSITLKWEHPDVVDGFMVIVQLRDPYPKQPNHIVKDSNITVDNLPPGVRVFFKICAYKGTYLGPASTAFASTTGESLPMVRIRELTLLKNLGTSVKVSWEKPIDARKANWVYGVYYGTNLEALLEGARGNTTALSATVGNLEACESYIFSVGLIAPYGTGPVLRGQQTIFTYMNDKAAPKKVSVQMNPKISTQMLVQWTPSCPNQKNSMGYMIEINDKTRNKVNLITVKDATGVEMSKVFNVSYGGVYEVRIRTFVENSIFSAPVTYNAPPIMPPHELKIFQEVNGSYVVYWSERNVSNLIGSFVYEVLVSEGNVLNTTTASRYQINSPPFVFHNHSADMYTFAVRMKTDLGYSSVLSERRTNINVAQGLVDPAGGASNVWSILLPVCLLLILLFGALGFLAVKYRRLQHSFTRFANSHYDTRSEAATFDDNILDEDDTPQIRGFSDDEPLVVA